eukprot:CAMPEP_0179468260 /NCGR_PEP_ID=MMETSP0799-20121207/49223_1 /TAXON_ID=46947 /ORGANISM="Geminigera cryophila, Strain CCMP2564" /LENGTH=68 /DNA_ID=CAMNT_0021274159 /DNA_START=59 /DNA_END=262 /DNA_ORIENTATION=+
MAKRSGAADRDAKRAAEKMLKERAANVADKNEVTDPSNTASSLRPMRDSYFPSGKSLIRLLIVLGVAI